MSSMALSSLRKHPGPHHRDNLSSHLEATDVYEKSSFTNQCLKCMALHQEWGLKGKYYHIA